MFLEGRTSLGSNSMPISPAAALSGLRVKLSSPPVWLFVQIGEGLLKMYPRPHITA